MDRKVFSYYCAARRLGLAEFPCSTEVLLAGRPEHRVPLAATEVSRLWGEEGENCFKQLS